LPVNGSLQFKAPLLYYFETSLLFNMIATIFHFSNNQWIARKPGQSDAATCKLVLCFASNQILSRPGVYESVKQQFPNAQIAMCSTAGEIFHDTVQEESLVAAAICFESTDIQTAAVNIRDFQNSFEAGNALVDQLNKKELCYILVLSDGSLVNGSELVKGLNSAVENRILVTGGLAGDGDKFNTTLVGLNSQPSHGNIIAIGFYGTNLKVTHGTNGGWQTFGLEKEVTHAAGNKLFELDSNNALDVYRKYLGQEADNLPGSALMFPLSVTIPGIAQPVVRTILGINHEEKSMTFAGDIPVGSKVRFMKANFDMLTNSASIAAQNTLQLDDTAPDFSLLVSCVGRKIILGPRTEEELEAVAESLGESTPFAGFYSYGEIAPFNGEIDCQLHNQTMTITSFYELS